MFKKYERSVLALANYSRHYGIDDEDELVFREYLSECSKSGNRPLSEISCLVGSDSIDNCLYELNLLKAEIELSSQVLSNKYNDDEIIKELPELFSDYIENEWSIENEEFFITEKSGQNWISKVVKFIGKKLCVKTKFDVRLRILLTKKIQFASEIEGMDLISEAWNTNGFIPFSDKWVVLDQKVLNSDSDIFIRIRK